MTVLRTSRTDHGIATRTLQREAAQHRLIRVSRGIYVRHESDDPEQQWLDRLDAYIERGGPDAAISHRAAARLHGLEGFTEGRRFEDITVPIDSAWRTSPALRSRTLTAADVTAINGLRVTTVARTLADLGRFVTADELEFAVEHALRGPERWRPDVWDRELLADLIERSEHRNARGTTVLRAVLFRRGPSRPTGSWTETLLVQHLRRHNVELTRQPTIVVQTHRGRRIAIYFPDLGKLFRGYLVEVDGAVAHGTDKQIDRDDRRQNELLRGFHVYRVHVRRLLSQPDVVAAEIAALHRQLPLRPSPFFGDGSVLVERTLEGAILTR